jgi:long-chain acyl-CoA synthetase
VNLAEILDPHPDGAAALVDQGRAITYGELRARVAEVRAGLANELGVGPGDRVGIALGNTWEFPVAFLAVVGMGAVAVPLNPSSPAPERDRQLEAVGARTALHAGALHAGVLPTRGPPRPTSPAADGDLACLLFTAGTAGSPKAAMLTHGNLLANQAQMQAHPRRALVPGDVSLAALPLHHIYGLNVVLLLSLRAGATVALVGHFDAAAPLPPGTTVVAGVPAMWRDWLAQPGPFPPVRLALSGAATLGASLAAAWRERGVVVHEGYGLTEAGPTVTSSAGDEPPRDGSIGLPLPGVEVRLVGPDGDDVLAGDPGEIWVRGPNVFTGYWEDPVATRAVLSRDGWLRTGDVAVAEDGWLYLVDRATDVINVSGFNGYPGEVEAVLTEHPAVTAAAVVGAPHPHSGETVTAYVVATAPLTAAEATAFSAARQARYKCPTTVTFVDALPEGVAGKVLRRSLRGT